MIRSTHVGSLVRPAELIAYMRAIDAGEPYDEAGYQACLRESVHEVVRRQQEAGVDVVSDGEYGKSSWNYYVYRRLAGIELRPYVHDNFGEMQVTATDWERFPEFYAEYFAKEQDFEAPGGWPW
jgi:5-methyltetrahydropteroyltriglutamate--homocysteine methyltransferase